MSIEEKVLERLRELPPERQQQVLEFADTLRDEPALGSPRHSLRGLWKDFNFDITEEDIAEARREMWGDFPGDVS